ncbi:hypothetical protein [Apilactobacillus ozensis]|nr:hypothetical protein [Apilactobacillus ozensis]
MVSFFSFNVSANSFRYNQRIIKTVQNYDGKQHQLVEDFSDYDLDAKKD